MKDPDQASRRLTYLISKWHGLVLVPALLIDAVVLTLSDRIWVTRGNPGRNGSPGMFFSHGTMLIAGIGVALYFGSPFLGNLTGASWRMREPTQGELGCALLLLRMMALFILYGWAISMVTKFG